MLAPVLTVAFVCLAQTAATVRRSSAGAPAAGRLQPGPDRHRSGQRRRRVSRRVGRRRQPAQHGDRAASGARSQLTNVIAAVVVWSSFWWRPVRLPGCRRPPWRPRWCSSPPSSFGPATCGRSSASTGSSSRWRPSRLRLVAVVGIEQGVVVAMVLSLADRTRRSARPRDAVLGREPGTDHWIPIDIGRPTEQVPGVLVYLVYAPLWYGNADYLRLRVRTRRRRPRPGAGLVLDADGISDIDYTGVQALRDLITELAQRGVPSGSPGPRTSSTTISGTAPSCSRSGPTTSSPRSTTPSTHSSTTPKQADPTDRMTRSAAPVPDEPTGHETPS